MYPVNPAVRSLLYEGFSHEGRGRGNYLRHRKRDDPEQRYRDPRWRVNKESLTSHSTHHTSFHGQFIQVRWPNQLFQSTELSQLVVQVRLKPKVDRNVTGTLSLRRCITAGEWRNGSRHPLNLNTAARVSSTARSTHATASVRSLFPLPTKHGGGPYGTVTLWLHPFSRDFDDRASACDYNRNRLSGSCVTKAGLQSGPVGKLASQFQNTAIYARNYRVWKCYL